MRVVVSNLLALAVVLGLTIAVNAQEKKEKAARERTQEGKITCAKCDLKVEGVTKCATVIVFKNRQEKEVIAYFDADADKKHHKAICTESKEGKVTGKFERKDGKVTVTVKEVKFKD